MYIYETLLGVMVEKGCNLVYKVMSCVFGLLKVVIVVKNPPANAGDVKVVSSIPRSRRSPGGGHGNPLQYFCLRNPMDRGDWWATVNRVTKSWTGLKRLSILRKRGKENSAQVKSLFQNEKGNGEGQNLNGYRKLCKIYKKETLCALDYSVSGK